MSALRPRMWAWLALVALAVVRAAGWRQRVLDDLSKLVDAEIGVRPSPRTVARNAEVLMPDLQRPPVVDGPDGSD